jgi:hypothetical protein
MSASGGACPHSKSCLLKSACEAAGLVCNGLLFETGKIESKTCDGCPLFAECTRINAVYWSIHRNEYQLWQDERGEGSYGPDEPMSLTCRPHWIDQRPDLRLLPDKRETLAHDAPTPTGDGSEHAETLAGIISEPMQTYEQRETFYLSNADYSQIEPSRYYKPIPNEQRPADMRGKWSGLDVRAGAPVFDAREIALEWREDETGAGMLPAPVHNPMLPEKSSKEITVARALLRFHDGKPRSIAAIACEAQCSPRYVRAVRARMLARAAKAEQLKTGRKYLLDLIAGMTAPEIARKHGVKIPGVYQALRRLQLFFEKSPV